MNKTLYEEAIADAKQLRELAEDAAKNRVIEAVMPQIRDLVNRRILGEQLEDEAIAAEILGVDPGSDLDIEDEVSEENLGAVINVSAQGDVNIDVEPEFSEDEESEEELVLDDTMAEALGRLIRGDIELEPTIEERVVVLERRVAKLRSINMCVSKQSLTESQKTRLNLSFIHCLREALKLRSTNILNEQNTQDNLERRLSAIIKEMKQMSKSNRRNIFDFLFEEDEKKKMGELEEAELSLELEDEEVTELADAEDADAVDAALADILGDVEIALGTVVGEEEPTEEVEEEETDEELDFDGEEVEATEEETVEEVYEIDEGMLRREIRRLRRLREQEEDRAAAADPALNHGGEDLGDVILDVNEDDLLNALADELGDPDVATPTVESRRRRSRARRRSRPVREGRGRNTRQLNQYRGAVSALKKQLVEMNLFNAKLLYANKLMQNKSLTTKQQRAIVEALDNARTLREAKLLYKSLSESLSRRARGKKLNEGSLRTLGSSSRSTRSAQSRTTSGVEADRWAVLAGMNPGND